MSDEINALADEIIRDRHLNRLIATEMATAMLNDLHAYALAWDERARQEQRGLHHNEPTDESVDQSSYR